MAIWDPVSGLSPRSWGQTKGVFTRPRMVGQDAPWTPHQIPVQPSLVVRPTPRGEGPRLVQTPYISRKLPTVKRSPFVPGKEPDSMGILCLWRWLHEHNMPITAEKVINRELSNDVLDELYRFHCPSKIF